MIFEYFVFSTVYIQNLFSEVHPEWFGHSGNRHLGPISELLKQKILFSKFIC